MRFGFVQRTDATGVNHRVVGSFTTETQAFAQQINLNVENCWAILKLVVESVAQVNEPAGRFLYLKDVLQQPTYRLIKMVEDEEEDEEDEEDGDSGL